MATSFGIVRPAMRPLEAPADDPVYPWELPLHICARCSIPFRPFLIPPMLCCDCLAELTRRHLYGEDHHLPS